VQNAISTKAAEAVLAQGTKCKEVRRFPLDQNEALSRDQALMNERRKVSGFGPQFAKVAVHRTATLAGSIKRALQGLKKAARTG
jgi:hypothetical protein